MTDSRYLGWTECNKLIEGEQEGSRVLFQATFAFPRKRRVTSTCPFFRASNEDDCRTLVVAVFVEVRALPAVSTPSVNQLELRLFIGAWNSDMY